MRANGVLSCTRCFFGGNLRRLELVEGLVAVGAGDLDDAAVGVEFGAVQADYWADAGAGAGEP